MMADRPILFSAPMIRALLDGRKTQTRRIIKPQFERCLSSGRDRWFVLVDGMAEMRKHKVSVGDRLWVRETWAPLTYLTHNDPGPQAIIDGGFYRADGGTVDGEVSKWKPSIFMPRHASRLTLTVTDVRVERLQDISEEDAIAEGIEKQPYAGDDPQYHGMFAWKEYSDHPHAVVGFHHDKPVLSYQSLWDQINGKGAWSANPWVVAYSFTVHRGNIDQIGRVA